MSTPDKAPDVVHMVFHDGTGNPDDDPDHERNDREIFYDEEIAPALAEIAGKLKARGMSICCVTEIEREESMTGRTMLVADIPPPAADTPCASFRLASFGVQCQGNADRLIRWLIEDARKHGHGSCYLRQLGIDTDGKDVDPRPIAEGAWAATQARKKEA